MQFIEFRGQQRAIDSVGRAIHHTSGSYLFVGPFIDAGIIDVTDVIRSNHVVVDHIVNCLRHDPHNNHNAPRR